MTYGPERWYCPGLGSLSCGVFFLYYNVMIVNTRAVAITVLLNHSKG